MVVVEVEAIVRSGLVIISSFFVIRCAKYIIKNNVELL